MNDQPSPPPDSSSSATLESVKTEAEKLKTAVVEEAGQTGAKIREEAKAAAGILQNAGLRYAANQKDALSRMAGEYAEAAAAAVDRLREGGEANPLAGPAGAAADQLGRLSRFLSESDPKEILREAGNLARQKPELFFGGMFLAGLITARFLKASSSRSPETARSYPDHQGKMAAVSGSAA